MTLDAREQCAYSLRIGFNESAAPRGQGLEIGMKNVLTAEIGTAHTNAINQFVTHIETVVARCNGITITKNEDGLLSAWEEGFSKIVPQNTGWIFGAETTVQQAIEKVLAARGFWSKLANGINSTEKK